MPVSPCLRPSLVEASEISKPVVISTGRVSHTCCYSAIFLAAFLGLGRINNKKYSYVNDLTVILALIL